MFRTFEDTFSEIERLYDARDYQRVVVSCGKLTEKVLYRIFSQFHTTLPQAEEKQRFLSFEEKQGEDYFHFIKSPSIGVGIRYYLALSKQFPEHQWLDPTVKNHLNCVNHWRNVETHAAKQSQPDQQISALPKDEDAAEVLQATEDIIRTLAMNEQAEAGEALPLNYYFRYKALKEDFNSASKTEDYKFIIDEGRPLAARFLDLLLERIYSNLSVEEKRKYLEFQKQVASEEQEQSVLTPYKSLFDGLRFQTRVTKSRQISDILVRFSADDKISHSRRATSPLIQLMDIIYQIIVDPKQQNAFRICDQVNQMLLEKDHLSEQNRLELQGAARFADITDVELEKIIESVSATMAEFPDLFSKAGSEEPGLSIGVPPTEVDVEGLFAEFDQLVYGRLAPTLVELIGHIWLNPDYESTSNSFRDSLRKNGGAKAVSRGIAAFNPLEEVIADLFKPHFKVVKDEQQKIELLNCLLHILDNHPPNRRLIDDDCLRNPRLLYQNLKSYVPADFDKLGDSELDEQFQRLLLLTCELIIDLFEGLPTWNAENLMSILGNQTVLLGHGQQIIDKWMASVPAASESSIQQFEEEYRREVARRYDELNLFGIDISKEARKYQLSVAYISLSMEITESVDPTKLHDSFPVEEVLNKYPKLVALGGAGQGKTTLMQWLTVMCGRKSFPESMNEWNERFPFLIKLRNVLDRDLPTVGEFTSIMAGELPTDSTYHQNWEQQIFEDGKAIIMVDGFDEVPDEKQEKVIIWLSEISQKYPKNRFILTSRPSSYRPEFSLADAGFEAVKLQPMTPDAMREFILHWHRAISLVINPINPDFLADEAEKLQDELKLKKSLRQLVTNPLLCGVICALHHDRHGYLPNNRTEIYEATCQMLLERRDVERQVAESDLALKSLSYTDKRVFLNDMAQWMMLNGQTVVEKSQVYKLFREKINYLPNLREKGLKEEKLLDYFLKRSGLLQQIGPNEVHFAHRTFQEYMAAKEFVDRDSMGYLKQNAGNDYWNETILLALGLCSNNSSNLFITELLLVARKMEDLGSPAQATRLYLLIMRGSDTMRQIPPDIQEVIEKKIQAIIPPVERETRAALVDSGDLAVPFLAKKPNRSTREDLYCALTLLQMRVEEAYALLLDYFQDDRASFIRNLSNLIRQLDDKILEETGLIDLLLRKGPHKYPLLIIEALVHVSKDFRLYRKFPQKRLKVTSDHMEMDLQEDFDWYVPSDKSVTFNFNLKSNTMLRSIQNLKVEQLSVSTLVDADAGVLNQFSELKQLKIDEMHNLQTFGLLFNLSRKTGTQVVLKELHVTAESVKSLGQGVKLFRKARIKIGKMIIEEITESIIRFAEAISRRAVFKIIHMDNYILDAKISEKANTRQFSLLVRMAEMAAARALKISIEKIEIRKLFNPSLTFNPKLGIVLQSLTNTREFEINGKLTDGIVIEDLRAINNLKQLRSLSLSGTRIGRASRLNGLTKLQSLDMSKTNINDLTLLSLPPSLEKLDLSNTNVLDTSPLESLTNLKDLNLRNSKAKFLTPLSQLQNLQSLDIRGTALKDTKPLANLPNLKQLYAFSGVNTSAIEKNFNVEKSQWDSKLIMLERKPPKKKKKQKQNT